MPDRLTELESLSRGELIELAPAHEERIASLESLTAELQARIADLERLLGLGGDPPGGTPRKSKAPETPARERRPRKKRTIHLSRRLEPAHETVLHTPDTCPDCGRALRGEASERRRRQIIDIEPPPVKVTDHVMMSRRCGYCAKRVSARPDLSGLTLGKRRIGLNLTALIARLRAESRLPVRSIARLLKSLWDMDISLGAITDILQACAAKGAGKLGQIRARLDASPVNHCDETGWRQDGVKAELWSRSCGDARLFEIRMSRSAKTAEEIVGERYGGTLVTDFYAGYNALVCRHQRRWPHYLRDLDELEQIHGEAVSSWTDAVKRVWRDARDYQDRCRAGGPGGCGVFDRKRMRRALEERLFALAEPYIEDQDAPQRVLAKRIGMFLSEMLTFVEYPEVPSDNNAAERAIRPLVILRRITGGARSQKGSLTIAALMSMTATWTLQGKDPFREYRALLAAPA